jgi:hypothetical protein
MTKLDFSRLYFWEPYEEYQTLSLIESVRGWCVLTEKIFQNFVTYSV